MKKQNANAFIKFIKRSLNGKKMDKLTVFIVGAKETGKTAISNHLAGLSESLTKEYRPTRGVR